MIRLLPFALLLILSACWPTSISFRDGTMPEEWKTFQVNTLEIDAATAPASYASILTEAIKDGIQNNTRLLLNPSAEPEITIDGKISSYSVAPIALQPGDVAAKNRLTVRANFTIFITAPEEDKMEFTLSKFQDYDANQDISTIENTLLEEINAQIVQDVVAKLLSNW
ncbi:MAG: LPS assembly lipoprotein LptE [Crocinitomicaceae bacterium]|nr:LPS assembly lipoprotein LptE [Crocinitomicaceae bacterium]